LGAEETVNHFLNPIEVGTHQQEYVVYHQVMSRISH
jgi:hypothetical protein